MLLIAKRNLYFFFKQPIKILHPLKKLSGNVNAHILFFSFRAEFNRRINRFAVCLFFIY